MSVTFIKSLRKSQDQCLRPLSYDDIQPSRVHDMGNSQNIWIAILWRRLIKSKRSRTSCKGYAYVGISTYPRMLRGKFGQVSSVSLKKNLSKVIRVYLLLSYINSPVYVYVPLERGVVFHRTIFSSLYPIERFLSKWLNLLSGCGELAF